MKLEVNISKYHIFILIGSLILVNGIFFVFAQDNTPNPGHSSDEIEFDFSDVQKRISDSCPSGQAIVSVGEDGTISCMNSGGGVGGSYKMDCYTIQQESYPNNCVEPFINTGEGVLSNDICCSVLNVGQLVIGRDPGLGNPTCWIIHGYGIDECETLNFGGAYTLNGCAEEVKNHYNTLNIDGQVGGWSVDRVEDTGEHGGAPCQGDESSDRGNVWLVRN